MDKAINALQWLVSEYKRTAIALILIAFAFPFVTTAVLYMERSGAWSNIYQAEHKDLKEIITRSVSRGVAMANELGDVAWYSQRTCINTATTPDLKLKCVRERRR